MKLSGTTRMLLLVSAAALLVVLFVPMWRIDLIAPQYPEGLYLTIHANGLQGNVEIINGLNHYIGMKTLHDKDFIEFTILPYIIIFFSLLFVAVAWFNRRSWLNVALILFICFGILAMYDFWRWEYDYGHNLDSNAAIKVPGMAYQPPLIGYKQLLNFAAYSFPDIGGWIFIGAGAIVLGCAFWEWRRSKKKALNIRPALAVLFLVFLSGCQSGSEPIVAGTDHCGFCKMTITDTRYAAEIVTSKGKVYKFDDIKCLLSYQKVSLAADPLQKIDIYLVDFTGEHKLIPLQSSLFLEGGTIHTPMNGNIIAFSNRDSLQKMAKNFQAAETAWDKIKP